MSSTDAFNGTGRWEFKVRLLLSRRFTASVSLGLSQWHLNTGTGSMFYPKINVKKCHRKDIGKIGKIQ